MGKYLNHDLTGSPMGPIGKAEALVQSGASPIQEPKSLDEYSGRAVICVVNNGFFEAAAWAWCESELEVFKRPDGRPKQWVLADLHKVEELAQ